MSRKAPSPLAPFHPAVREWFLSALGEPTPAQTQSWPSIAKGDSTLLLAPTGSGKTLAAFLSAIDRLACSPEPDAKKRLRVLYISPLKALAVDIDRNLRAPLAGIREAATRLGTPLRALTVGVRTGDTPPDERAKMLRHPPDVLITTPESLYLLLTSRQREILTSVDTVIIDEIHQLAATKRGAHLFLSLERLEALLGADSAPLQRIGLSATQRPLEEVARLLGGFDTSRATPRARPVAIIDASAKKALSITVEVPPPLAEEDAIETTESGGGRSIWPSLHARLVERIRAARSTMVFVNSRRLAERLATALNEVAGEEIALAHHGSVAREKRKVIEERLKVGDLPAIVATSSLELGLDMAAVDQVIQVEAPPSVASGIQRIGRASHHVGGVPSGVLVPKHKHDLLACATASIAIEAGDVEETFYPRNPLDVLAQQIVAIASVGLRRDEPVSKARKRAATEADEPTVETDVDAIWALVRRAAPFTDLPRSSFEGVLDMLAGRYPSDEFAGLRARITWDRTRGVVLPRAGAKRLAIMNAGTIPDRGLYGVFLADGASGDGEVAGGSSKAKPARRVGELDEEMVFELSEGEVFLLGASSWRAEEITRDRVLVTPAAGIPGKMPFWHGDRSGRTLAFGSRVGKLTRDLAERSRPDAASLLRTAHHLDELSAEGLVEYVHDQVEATGSVPSDRSIVVERSFDELGDLRICVLSPFGGRVHAPWAMAALRRLRDERAGDIEGVWSDDGMVFRVPGGDGPPPNDFLFPAADEIEDIITRELAGTSLFGTRFREAASRALLLPRQSVGKRTPLWAQRKRAADLLAVATRYPSFPIVLETYREVLRDAFDLPGLVGLLRSIESRNVRVSTVDVRSPSPFAASLLFTFVGNFIYDDDAPVQERRAQALTIDHAQLKELLGDVELRKLLDPEVVADHEAQLQRRDRPLKNRDAIHDLLLWLGDTPAEAIELRAPDRADARAWIDVLRQERRVLEIRIGGEPRLIAVEDAGRYRDALGVVVDRGVPAAFLEPTTDALVGLVARHARTHGPFQAADVAKRFAIGEASAVSALDSLTERDKVSTGAFLPLSAGSRPRQHAPLEYCDTDVLRALKQKTLARLRKLIEPVSSEAFARFLAEWHAVVPLDTSPPVTSKRDPVDALLEVVSLLEGCPVPASVLERDVLPARIPGFERHHLDQLLASGEVVWAGVEPIGSNDGRVALYRADREPLLARPPNPEAAAREPIHASILELLERRGAIFFSDIVRHTGGYPGDTVAALWDLVWAGDVTNDTFEPLRSVVRGGSGKDRSSRRGFVPRARSQGPRGSEGRWSLRRARWAGTPTPTEAAAALTSSLLERYGVVLREAPRAEGIAGGFSVVYDVFRVLEEQGRVRRGYFVAGRGATQFALPGAEERLRTRPSEDGVRVRLAATDPANPYGALVPWPSWEGRAPQRSAGAHVLTLDGKLRAWTSRGGRNVTTFLPAEEPDRSHAAVELARALADVATKRGRASLISTINGSSAPDSPLAHAFGEAGYVPRQGSLLRLPTARSASPEAPEETEEESSSETHA